MATPKFGILEPVDLRKIWPHEAHDFTTWLSENLHYLETAVSMKLELVEVEHWSPGAGQVDILAKEVESDSMVVIENQLEHSDDGHFARLIGYAAGREASFLVWVARDFGKWHRDMVTWLNAQGVQIFAVKVSVYRIGKAYAPRFDVLVGPDDETNVAGAYTSEPTTIYGRFYPPLTADLRKVGIVSIGGRQGGWTGTNRTFRTGIVFHDAGVVYRSKLGLDGAPCEAGLLLYGPEQSNIFQALLVHQEELEESMGKVEVFWKPDNRSWESSVDNLAGGNGRVTGSDIAAYYDPIPDDETEESLEAARTWMKDTLVRFRDVFQPRLEKIASSLREESVQGPDIEDQDPE